jgi:hypothetical protein
MKTKTILWDGKPIDRPCIIKDMPLSAYHGQCCFDWSVSSTNLRRVLECNGGSPAHFFCEWSGNPNRVEADEEKAHFVLGRAVHHLLLGEKSFGASFAIRPSEWRDWRTAASKQWRELTEASGKSVLTEDQIEAIRQMAISVGSDTLVRGGLLGGQIERSMFWQDEESGLWCKARPDAIPTDSGDFADLKTTTDVHYPDLVNTVRKFAYHQQAALIAEAAEIVAGVQMSSFTFLFVEKTPPYCVRPLHLQPQLLDIGHKLNRVARRLIAACLKTNRWLGPGEGHIVNIDLSERYREQALNEIAQIEEALERA